MWYEGDDAEEQHCPWGDQPCGIGLRQSLMQKQQCHGFWTDTQVGYELWKTEALFLANDPSMFSLSFPSISYAQNSPS